MYIKNSWERDIELDLKDRRRSVEWALNYSGENKSIEKSLPENSVVEIKGEELNKKIDFKLKDLDHVLSSLKEGANGLEKSIGDSPLDLIKKGLNNYSFDQIYKSMEDKEKTSEMRSYNNLLNKIFSLEKESFVLKSILSKTEDNQSYKVNSNVLDYLSI